MNMRPFVIACILAFTGTIAAQQTGGAGIDLEQRQEILIGQAFHRELAAFVRARAVSGKQATPEEIRTVEDSIRTAVTGRITAADEPGAVLKNMPYGAIAGHVYESNGSTPVANINVLLYNGSGGTVTHCYTDGSGAFLLTPVSPGDYYLYTGGYTYNGMEFYPEYYDGSSTLGGATPVTVSGEETVEGINFTLERYARITGRVIAAATGEPIQYMMVEIIKVGDPYGCNSGFADANGYYTIWGVSPGTYRVRATGYQVGYGEFYVEEYYNNSPNAAGADPVSVSGSETISGIDFSLIRGFHVYTTSLPSWGGWANITPQKLVYPPGDVVTLTAQPTTDYLFDHWSGDASGTSSSVQVTLNSDAYVNVHFVPANSSVYTLSLSAVPPEGGYYQISPNQTEYDSGAVVIVTATANTYNGYVFSGFGGDHSGMVNPAEITMDGNKVVTVNFGHTLLTGVSPAGSGSVSRSPAGEVYDHNETVTLTAQPAQGWAFDHWEGDISGSVNPAGIVISENRSVEAVFVRKTYTLTMEVYSGEGTTTPATGSYPCGADTVIEISANPADGYRFYKWYGEVADPNSAQTTVTMTGDKLVKAKFESSQASLTIQVIPTEGGTTTPAPGVHIVEKDSVVSLEAVANEGYLFDRWEGYVASTTSPVTTITVPHDKTVKAYFKKSEHQLTVENLNPDKGSTVPAPGTYMVKTDSVVTLTAQPADDCRFVKWYGSVADEYSATTTVTVNEDKTVKAKFESARQVLTMQVSPAEGGTTDPAVGSHLYDTGATVTVTAYPAAGYRFVQWDGYVSDANSPETAVTMSAYRTVKAVFGQINHSLKIHTPDEGGGTTDPAPGIYYFGGDTVVTVRAVPAEASVFVRWQGDVDAPYSAETTVSVTGHMTIKPVFSGPDHSPPQLKKCHPSPQAQEVPGTAKIQMKVKDYETGINMADVYVSVDDMPIIAGGADQTGGCVHVTYNGTGYSFVYQPARPFEEGSEVRVSALFKDFGDPANVCDTTYSFMIGSARVDTVGQGDVGLEGGTVTAPGVVIDVPAGALEDTVTITISEAENLPDLPSGVNGMTVGYHFGPDGLQFSDSVMVRLPYTPEDLAHCGVSDPLDLTVMYYHTVSGEWVQLRVVEADEVEMFIWVKVGQFCFLTFAQGTTQVDSDDSGIARPERVTLSECYPNPFNPVTQIEFDIRERCDVELLIANTNGRVIRHLLRRAGFAGHMNASWDGMTDAGYQASSGLYLVILKAGSEIVTRKVTFLK
ncbi:carboxypeptidase regulatory-like domain-containing protein [bacterium]|nr:carboxypeptidase regulatory-like domain-containing protein [bacterium]